MSGAQLRFLFVCFLGFSVRIETFLVSLRGRFLAIRRQKHIAESKAFLL